MQCFRKVTEDLYWVGGNDRQIELFENIFPLAKGVSYNSYLLLDEQTVLFDTADYAIGKQFIENVMSVLNGRNLDYIVVNHMEPDHCSLIGELLLHYPDVKIIGNAKTFPMIEQFFSFDLTGKTLTVKEGDTFCSGKHTFRFIMSPMVHWPEAMMTYDEKDKVLFSADAFGTFNALNGNLFNDELDFNREWLDEARRYYTNIVGKYGPQVQNVLKKAILKEKNEIECVDYLVEVFLFKNHANYNQEEMVKFLYENGVSQKQIARYYVISERQVRNFLGKGVAK